MSAAATSRRSPVARRLELDDALGGALADDDLSGAAQQVGVGELDAGRGVAVVEDDLEARRRQLVVEALGQGALRLVAGAHEHEVHGERRDARRPDDAPVVVVLFDGRGGDARQADAVAAHDDGLLLAMLVEVRRAHRLRVLGPELEDVADLDDALALERRLALRAGVAGASVAEVREADAGRGRRVTASAETPPRWWSGLLAPAT